MRSHARVRFLFSAAVLLPTSLPLALWSATCAFADTFRTITSASQAVIVVDHTYWTTAEQKAADMLQDEIKVRTGITIPVVDHSTYISQPGVTAFLVGRAGRHAVIDILRPGLSLPAEGFRLETMTSGGGDPYVICAGKDTRGSLFAVGKCLRKMAYASSSLTIPTLNENDAPEMPIRGHQLGYRSSNNTWDSWDLLQFEQYIRDLLIFGVNSIELIPPRSPSDTPGPLMPRHPWEMTQLLCDLLDTYDLNVWMWLPADVNLSDPGQRAQMLSDRTALFAACSRIDAIFVPGGDPGSNSPNLLMDFVEDLAAALRIHHPAAQVWVSHQGWEFADRNWLYNYLQTVQPAWLTGVVYGPWARDTVAGTRAAVPSQYGLRHYPDIGHTVRCQYPVPQWDHSFALTEGREATNPRPNAEAHICSLLTPYTDGAITYSDGVNDDINKAVWSARLWDSTVSVSSVLSDYNRYFFRNEFGAALVDDIVRLEDNWNGPVTTNAGIDTTLAHWQAFEAAASANTLSTNWRFQQLLLRAYYDAYVKARRIEAAQIEGDAYDDLAQARTIGANPAINNALATLATQDSSTAGADLRARILELGEALNSTIGMQLSVPMHGASGAERGAVLDFLYEYLNNRAWLQNELNGILLLSSESDKLVGITRILGWEMGGPDGYYDDLGNATGEPHLIHAKTWEEDPGFVESAQDEFDWQKYPTGRLSWRRQGQTLYDTPLQMQFDGLNPSAGYTLKVTYAGRFDATMTLDADGTLVHGATAATNPPTQYQYTVPQALTADGELTLSWQRVTGRGPQVAEVWLLRSDPYIVINSGAAQTSTPALQLALWARQARDMQFQYPGSGGWTAWEPFYFSKDIVLCGASGTVQVDFRVRFTDASISGVCSDTIIMDIVQPPAGLSISINAGAACADSSTVTLTLAATGADEMRFRNESGAWSPWEDFAASKVWTLSPGRGSKTVGFQCRNLCASQSAEVTDTIRLRVFDDVPCGHSQRPYVEALVREGITSGCSVSPPLYCPLSSVTRAQMAVFIIRAMDETPYSNPTPTFTDVPAGHWAYGCIERMYQLGITGGCSTSPMRYCPDAPVNRSQMAVFLCRAAGKGPLTPGTPTFADVLPSASFYGYVERLADPVSWGGTAVTGGCTVNPKRYCPYDAVTRGQMAVFLCRAFSIGL